MCSHHQCHLPNRERRKSWHCSVETKVVHLEVISNRKERSVKKLFALIITCVVILQYSQAQDSLRTKPSYLHSGKIGLGLDGITGSPNLLLKYFFNNQLAMQVIVGMELDVPGGSPPLGYTKVTGLTVRGGVGILLHLTQDQVSPYVGIEGIFQYAKSGGFYLEVEDPKNSILASGVFGAEFFLNERFSVGIKQNLGIDVRLKRDTPSENTDIKFSTSTLITGRFYFN